jgi:hypothetical protein
MKLKIGEPIFDWLLEPDNLGVKYLALRDLVNVNAKEVETAKIQAHDKGPIAQILANINKDGYWEKPETGYYLKYTGTVWSIILL